MPLSSRLKKIFFTFFIVITTTTVSVYIYDPALSEEETIHCLKYFLLKEPEQALVQACKNISFKKLKQRILSEEVIHNHFACENFLRYVTQKDVMRSYVSSNQANLHSGKRKFVAIRSKCGMGNQLFHYATAYALAKKINAFLIVEQPRAPTILQFDTSARDGVLDIFNFEYNMQIPLIAYDNNAEKKTGLKLIALKILRYMGFRSPPLDFNKTFFLVTDDNFHHIDGSEADIFLVGFGCTYWYENFSLFKDKITDIRGMMNPLAGYQDRTQKIRERIQQCENSVAMHVRRGDFLLASSCIMPITYYTRAMEKMDTMHPGSHFFIFTDSPEHVRPLFIHLPNCEVVSDGTLTNIDEFFLMTECKHMIIANSTFSQWAGYLKAHGDIIAPLQRIHGRNEDRSIYPEHWMTLNPFVMTP